MKAIDIHSHLYPRELMQALERHRSDASAAGEQIRLTLDHPYLREDPMFFGELDQRIAMMDAAGIETQVLSFSTPMIWHPDPLVKAELCRAFNDGCLEVAANHPGRFKLFALMPLPFVEETLAETERLAPHPDVLGVGMSAFTAGWPVEDERLDPIYSDWSARGLTAFLHPDPFPAPGLLDDYRMTWSIGAPVEDLIVALRLIHSGVMARHPGITWIVPHLGGALPFLLRRVDFNWELPDDTGPKPSESLANLYVDAATLAPGSLRLTRDVLGADRILYASDFPFVSRQSLEISRGVIEAADLSARERAAILGDNAVRLGLALEP